MSEIGKTRGRALACVLCFFCALLTGCTGLGEAPRRSAEPTYKQRALAGAAYIRADEARSRGDATGAIGHLRDAAELGHAQAAYELGLAYADGDGVPKDLEQSAYWINRAADLGSPGARFLVGASFYGGIGVEQDIPRGLAFLGQAAVQGHPKAQFLLGQAYSDGVGVTVNPEWAARWYGKAAYAGHAQAQYALGVMYATGFGVPRSPRQAYRWLSLAADNGYDDAIDLRNSMLTQISTATRARVDSQTAHFLPRESRGNVDPPTVMYVQIRLRALGFDVGPVDGIFGPRTRNAIEAFQSQQHMKVDGEISRALVEDLFERQSPDAA